MQTRQFSLRSTSIFIIATIVMTVAAPFDSERATAQPMVPGGGNMSASLNGNTSPNTLSTSPGASGAGSGSGPSIESILLQYQASAESAADIAQELNNVIDFRTNPNHKVIIATPNDINAIVELKIALGQATIIHVRVTDLTTRIKHIRCTVASVTPTVPTPRTVGEQRVLKLPINLNIPGYTDTAANLQTLIQTVASLGAVSESLAPAAGSLNDTSLINLVAGDLPRGTVLVPSIYPPGVIHQSFDVTLIGQKIQTLENDRNDLYKNAAKTLVCTDPSDAVIMARYIAETSAASSLIDSFETSLLSGVANIASSNTPNAGAAMQGGANQNNTSDGPNSQNNTQSPTPTAATTSGIAGSTGATIVQLLYADDLLRQILIPVDKNIDYYFVSVHSLESGGSTLTRSTLFTGSHLYFSGGTASTFTLFQDDGTMLCSGISYGYRGFIQDKDIGTAALMQTIHPGAGSDVGAAAGHHSGEILPGVAHFTSSCPASLPSP